MKPDLRNSKDLLSGLLFLAIGIGAIVVARDYPFGTPMRMGSGYFNARARRDGVAGAPAKARITRPCYTHARRI